MFFHHLTPPVGGSLRKFERTVFERTTYPARMHLCGRDACSKIHFCKMKKKKKKVAIFSGVHFWQYISRVLQKTWCVCTQPSVFRSFVRFVCLSVCPFVRFSVCSFVSAFVLRKRELQYTRLPSFAIASFWRTDKVCRDPKKGERRKTQTKKETERSLLSQKL